MFKFLIAEFLPFVHEVSSLTYCQEAHLGSFRLSLGKWCGYLWYLWTRKDCVFEKL